MKKQMILFFIIICFVCGCATRKVGDSSIVNNDNENIIGDTVQDNNVDAAEDNKEDGLSEKYQTAMSYYDNKDYVNARTLFIELGEYENSSQMIETINNEIYDKVVNLFEAANYDEATEFAALIDTSGEWSDYTKVTELIANAKSDYLNSFYDEADSIYRESGEDSLEEYVEEKVCAIFSDNDASKLVNEITEKYKPIKLTDCNLLFSENLTGIEEENVEDIYENLYDFGIKYYDPYVYSYSIMNYEETFELYDLGLDYVQLKATLVPYSTGGDPAAFFIYGDDRCIYSTKIEELSKPIDIDLDVSGVEELKIAFFGGYHGSFLLAEPYLYKSRLDGEFGVSDYTNVIDLSNGTIDEWKAQIKSGAEAEYIENGIDGLNSYVFSWCSEEFSKIDAAIIRNEILKEYAPVELSDINLLKDNKISSYVGYFDEDALGNVYEYSVEYAIPYSNYDSYELYYLGGNYKRFSMMLAPLGESKLSGTFTIYADDVAVYSVSIDGYTSPIIIDLDLTGVEELKLNYYGSVGGMGSSFLLGNPYLYKK